MTSKIKTAFDSIYAEDVLKANTLLFLRAQMREKNKARSAAPVRRIAVALASLAIAVAGVFASYNLYFTESVYIDLDVNPSIELAANRFDRIIGSYAYNADGTDILSEINIMHKSYWEAVEIAIDAMEQRGYITNEALISVTLQTGDEKKDADMLTNIETVVQNHHGAAQVNAFSVDSDTRTAAHELNLSPAKYLAILDLQEVDPSATIESCREHSIGEIYRLTESHTSGHHNAAAAEEPTEESSTGETRHDGYESGRHNGSAQNGYENSGEITHNGAGEEHQNSQTPKGHDSQIPQEHESQTPQEDESKTPQKHGGQTNTSSGHNSKQGEGSGHRNSGGGHR